MLYEPHAALLEPPSCGGVSTSELTPPLPTDRREVQLRSKTPPPAAIQPPDRCPYCNSANIKRFGTRQNKHQTVSVYRCQFCTRYFTPGSPVIRSKKFSPQFVIEALSLYNQHHTLENTARQLTRRHGRPVDTSTVSRWVKQYSHLTSYHAIRPHLCGLFATSNVMRRRKLPHAQVYTFIAHRPKLQALRDGTLGGPKRLLNRFVPLADFLDTAPDRCPHGLFRDKDGPRGSRLAPTFLDPDKLIATQTTNAATEMARMVIPTVGRNIQRHEKLQSFMLLNDRSTLAVEVPIWLTEPDIAALEARWGITIIPKVPLDALNPHGPHKPRKITGHIDFLQLRHDNVHVLDYKPTSRRERPFAQLTIYALALTQLIPGLRLFDIRCAWFDEHQYNEFYPRTVLPVPPAKPVPRLLRPGEVLP